MRKKDKLINLLKANLLSEQRYLNTKFNINEIDYSKVYQNTNPWDNQGQKKSDTSNLGNLSHYPKYSNFMDDTINARTIDYNRNKNPDTLEFINKLKFVKNAFEKKENGEPLTDDEKQLIRYQSTGKEYQASRVSNVAKNKLSSAYKEEFDIKYKSQFDPYMNKPFEISSNDNSISVVITNVSFETSGVHVLFFRFELTDSNNVKYILDIHNDGSYGVYSNEEDNNTKYFKVDYDAIKPLIFKTKQIISRILPDTNYTR